MPLNVSIHFDVKPIENRLNERFGIGSRGQAAWDSLVFFGSQDYFPYDTGETWEHNKATNEARFGQGELIYSTPPGHQYPFLIRWLWTGLSETGARRIKRYTRTSHPLAGGQWTTTAANNDKPVWVNEFQKLIDDGEV